MKEIAKEMLLFNSASSICSTLVFRKGEKKQMQDVFVEEQEFWVKLLIY